MPSLRASSIQDVIPPLVGRVTHLLQHHKLILSCGLESHLFFIPAQVEVPGDEGLGLARGALGVHGSLVQPLTFCVSSEKRLGLSGLLFLSHKEPTKRMLGTESRCLVSGSNRG